MHGSRRKGMVIQERDLTLLRALADFVVIDREQAKCIAGFGSTTRANSRLLLLTLAGLLRKFFIGTAGGAKKALYALSLKGALLIGVPYRGPRRKQDEVLVADFFITHRLAINEIHCMVEKGLIPSAGAKFVRWVSFFESIERDNSLIPDGYFEVVTPERTWAAFLEVDLGHERHVVWHAKVQAYLRYAKSGNFERQFHKNQFRVLVVTNSERRMQSLRNATAVITEKLFWFSTFEKVQRDGFWASTWLRPKDNQLRSLL
jgi:Replication-relaxation